MRKSTDRKAQAKDQKIYDAQVITIFLPFPISSLDPYGDQRKAFGLIWQSQVDMGNDMKTVK